MSVPEPAVPVSIALPEKSDTTDAEERSQQLSTLEASIGPTSGSGSGSDDANWFNQLMDLSSPGAGLRNIEMPISEIESIFDSIFAGEQGSGNESGNEISVASPPVDMVQMYGSYEDMYVPFMTKAN